MTTVATDLSGASPADGDQPFVIEMRKFDGQRLRVGRQSGSGIGVRLILCNGIGGNIELLAPIARWMPRREVITFDIPGWAKGGPRVGQGWARVGHAPLPTLPYRLTRVAYLARACSAITPAHLRAQRQRPIQRVRRRRCSLRTHR